MVLIEISGIIVSIFLLLLGLLYWHRKKSHEILAKAGIVGPKPHWLFGNLIQMRTLPIYELIPEWTRKYGRTWGYYEGPTPIIVTSDVELLQEVFVKQFRNFHGRKLFPVQPNPDTSKRVNLFMARGQKWKQLRSTLNPSFTESRMKQMFPLVDRCIETMLNAINDEVKKNGKDENIDIYKFFQGLTLDSICECAFGVELGSQNDPNSIIIDNLRTFFSQDRRGKPIAIMGMIFPELRYILNDLMSHFRSKDDPVNVLVDLMRQVIVQRKNELKEKGNSKRVDILQLLLDSEVCPMSADTAVTPTNTIDNETSAVETTTTTTSQKQQSSSSSSYKVSQKKYLEEGEITAQAVLFLFAGYETSSTALAFCAFELIRNPHVLARLHDEIDSAMQDFSMEDKTLGSVNFYRAICRLPYLEAVIWETLRFYPFASTAINRNCMTVEGVQLGNMKIPEGVIVAPDAKSVHFDEDLWGPIDVKKFDPDRHLVTNNEGKLQFVSRDHAMAMLAFGVGPRNCIGQRFALMEIRACLVRFLYRFTIEKSLRTPNELPVKFSGTVAPKDGVWVKVIERKEL